MSDSIRNGYFTSGKWFGQPQYAPYFLQQVKDGLADEKHGNMYVFDITKKDVKKFPELDMFDIVKVFIEGKDFAIVESGYEEED